MLKRDELTNPDSCLSKAADDEPIFVLRAQDATAAIAVRQWARYSGLPRDHPKYQEAMQLAAMMDAWPVHKKPD